VRQYSLKKVIATLRTHHGLISLAADALGCSRSTLYRYVEAYPEVAAVVEEERERLVDMAVDALYYHVEQKVPWAIALVLKTLGRQRGYGDRPILPANTPPPATDDLSDWPQVLNALIQALADYPEARLAVVEALQALEPHESTNGHYPGA
jgi:Bacterial regulatory protein, Fis family